MKNLNEIINTQPMIDGFNGLNSIIGAFDLKENDLLDVNILFAHYTYENYNGECFILFERYGVLYEVNASHCSCYGLENQWDYEEVVLEELYNRLKNEHYQHYEFVEELKIFLGIGDV